VEFGVVYLLAFEDREEVPHDGSTQSREGLPGYGNDGSRVWVLVAELDKTKEYRIGLPRPGASLMYLDA
jgi:hypothetical protein